MYGLSNYCVMLGISRSFPAKIGFLFLLSERSKKLHFEIFYLILTYWPTFMFILHLKTSFMYCRNVWSSTKILSFIFSPFSPSVFMDLNNQTYMRTTFMIKISHIWKHNFGLLQLPQENFPQTIFQMVFTKTFNRFLHDFFIDFDISSVT